MANKCNACGKFASATDGAKCSKCTHLYHRQCVNINNDAKILNKWRCNECKSKNTGVGASTVKNITPSSCSSGSADTDYSDACGVTGDRGRADIDVASNIKFIRDQLSTIISEMAAFRQEISKINSNISELSTRVDCIESRLDNLEKREENTQAQPMNPQSESSLTELKYQINDRDQSMYLNDIEITGVTERKGENIMQLVTLLATKIGVEVDERDVVSVERVGVRREQHATDLAASNKPRPIVVCFTRRAVRDNMLRAARVRRGADTSGLNIIGDEPRRFYVNERLTRINRLLFYKAREEGRRKGWRYVWTRDGCIFARRDSDTNRQRIRSEKDLITVFGA